MHETQNACLGVYYNESGNIFIKQLGTIHSDKQCLLSKQCILDIDPLNSQSFSCCCSSDNCTLDWQIIFTTTTTTTTFRSILTNNSTIKNVLINEQNDFLWKLFVIIFIIMIILILIMFTFGLWKVLKTKQHKNSKSVIKSSSSSSSSSIEHLFFSAQQIINGKNSTVYKANFHNEIIALKLYNQTNILMWKNEVNLLQSIKHESIIK